VSVVANVAINVDSRGAVSKLRQVQTQAQSTEKAFGALQSAIGALGVGFALTKVIADVKELDTNLRRLGTVGVDVAKISPALSKLSDELGGVASKAELAAASYQAASAGFSDTAGNINILRAATKAAVGGLADTQAVTEVLVKTLNSYGLAGDQAAKVTDSISKAVELGNQEWSDYTSQLGRVASIAALVGVSVDELNAFISSATLNGATAEIAFTGLGATLSQIITPTKESQEAAAKLGIAWNYGGLQAKGFSGLMAELAIAMEKDKEAASRMVGPIEAARGAFAAASKDGSDFKNILEQIGGAAGKTDADFQTMKGSLENTLKALDTSFKNLSEALGTAFGPTVVIVVQDITKAVNGFADFMATVPQPVMNTAGELVKLIAQMLLLQKAIQAIIALRLGFIGAMVSMTGATVASGAAATTSAGAFALYTNNTRALQAQAATATPVLNGLKNVLSTIAAIGVITVAVNIAVSGFQSLLAANAELAKLRGRKSEGGAAAMFAGSTKEEVARQQEIARKTKKHEEKTLAGLQSPGSRIAQFVNLGGVLEGFGVPSIGSASRRGMQGRARIGSAEAVLGLDPNKFPSATPTLTPTPTTATGATVGGGGGRAAASGASKAADEKRRAAEELANLQGQVTLKEKLFGIDKQIAVEKQRGSIVTAAALEMDKALEERQARIAEITRSTADTATKNAQIKEATLDADQKIYAVQQAIKEQEAERTKSFNEIIAGLDLELALKTATTEQAREQLRLAYELAKLQGQGFTPEQIGAITAKKTELARPKTDRERLEGAAAGVKAELDALTDPINMITTAAAGIGDAFSTSFKGIISGSMTAKEALASFFTSVADMFLDMAAQIIAKMIQMAILNTIVGLLPGAGGAGGFTAGPLAAVGDVVQDLISTLARFELRRFKANGGPVSSGQTYMVGERGPELFVPGRSGTIVANDKMGGGSTNVIVNVDAKGSSVEGNEQGANQLGRVISAAVQSELIKQQRPGGILAR
jgi:TP901 family phage tail tape measure protein